MNKILQGDCLQTLKTLPDQSVHCCVTSPPYWGLRDYGKDGQIGLEQTPEEFVAKLVEVFREVRRVLRDDGTLWLNLGDSYARQGGQANTQTMNSHRDTHRTAIAGASPPSGFKPKDLIGIPWMVAFALRADGWYLRQDIIWHKPNPMPESVTDRCTKAHEYVFLMTKNERYYYDTEAVSEASSENPVSKARRNRADFGSVGTAGIKGTAFGQSGKGANESARGETRNRRSVWTVTTKPYSGAHFATYPVDLIAPCILAGTSAEGCCPTCGNSWERVVEKPEMPKVEDSALDRYGNGTAGVHRKVGQAYQNWRDENKTVGWKPTCDCGGNPVPCVVLDPFMGAGTTAIAAVLNQRQYVGCELNPEYIEIAERRIQDECGLFLLGDLG